MFKWKLRACRVQAGLTQKEVAAELGVSEVSLVAYETGKRMTYYDETCEDFEGRKQ